MKNFAAWNQVKEILDGQKRLPFFSERDIFYAALGVNVGFEQDGKTNFLRPVLILKKYSRHLVLAVPLSTTEKTGKHYFEFSFLKNQKSKALVSQLRAIDTRRLQNKIGRMQPTDFKALKKAIQDQLE